MKLAALILAALLVPATARADKWTGTDTVLEITTVSLLAIDYIQTTEIVADGRDSNPMVNATSPGAYFATATVVHVVAVAVLPQPYRRIAQGITIGIQLDVIHTNWQGGYGFSF